MHGVFVQFGRSVGKHACDYAWGRGRECEDVDKGPRSRGGGASRAGVLYLRLIQKRPCPRGASYTNYLLRIHYKSIHLGICLRDEPHGKAVFSPENKKFHKKFLRESSKVNYHFLLLFLQELYLKWFLRRLPPDCFVLFFPIIFPIPSLQRDFQ